MFKSPKDRWVIVRIGKREGPVMDSQLVESIRESRRLLLELRNIEQDLIGHKALIVKSARQLLNGEGTLSFLIGNLSCTVTLRHEAVIPPENVKKLRKLLGKRFDSIVRQRYVFPLNLLKNMPEKTIMKLIMIKELSPQLKWEDKGSDGQSG